MNTHADKASETKSTSMANGSPKRQPNGRATVKLLGNKPEATALKKMQELANDSPQVSRLRALQRLANNSPQAKQLQALADATSPSPSQQEIANSIAQLAQESEEEELIQAKPQTAQRQPNETDGKPVEHKTGLPDNLKAGIESLSGLSLDHVRVHYNSAQPAQLNALAYAQGSDIHLAPGQEQHLPHEAWHIVQQAQGRVQPTMQMKDGVPVNDDAGLEREADVMGARAIQKKPALANHAGKSTTVQLVHQHAKIMHNRRRFKRSLKTAITRILAIKAAGPATAAQIRIHDEVQNAGVHHGFRNVTVAQLINDIRTTIANQTALNLIDSNNP
jgi:DNA uptake protein ComE-like DNA-binding protein